MTRITLLLCVILFAGCSRKPVTDTIAGRPVVDIEQGGTVKNADRDKAEEYFAALGKVRSADEEKVLLTEFGEWLENKGYKIRAEIKNGRHDLSCPYFPPVTPWISHSFLDVNNLELLPHH